MIQYSLKCDQDHHTQSWFKSAAAFDVLEKAGHLACAICGSAQVTKALMAPRVNLSEDATAPRVPVLSEPAGEAEQAIAAMRKKVEETSDYVGDSFTKEARAMHSGEKPERSIYGEARLDQAKALIEGWCAVDAAAVPAKTEIDGVSPEGRITTLGRGGSDTTAVAFAAAFEAERCDIYTDVDGVYTTDPRVEAKARKLDKISFEEMLELASLGAKVLQTRSVELAMRYKVKLRVLSSFEEQSDEAGTLVCDEEEIMESNVVAGVAFSREEAKMTLNISEEGRTDMTWSCPVDQVKRAEQAMEDAKSSEVINYADLLADKDVAKVSVVGIGMRSHTGVAAKMFQVLSNEGINIQVITTSEIKISVLINRKYMELAVQALHDAFELDKAA
ncbi:Aspartate kinase [Nymphon striatum]|nr:Aspartate kinase [Nymphon striatum]